MAMGLQPCRHGPVVCCLCDACAVCDLHTLRGEQAQLELSASATAAAWQGGRASACGLLQPQPTLAAGGCLSPFLLVCLTPLSQLPAEGTERWF